MGKSKADLQFLHSSISDRGSGHGQIGLNENYISTYNLTARSREQWKSAYSFLHAWELETTADSELRGEGRFSVLINERYDTFLFLYARWVAASNGTTHDSVDFFFLVRHTRRRLLIDGPV